MEVALPENMLATIGVCEILELYHANTPITFPLLFLGDLFFLRHLSPSSRSRFMQTRLVGSPTYNQVRQGTKILKPP